MTAKEYLNQAYIIDRRINMTLAKSQKLRESLYGRGQKLDDVGGGKGGGGSDIIGETIAKVIDYERQADELIDRLVAKRIEIEQSIQALPDSVQREVLERRYLLFQSWDGYYDKSAEKYIKGIYEYMGYSRSRIFEIHGEALKNINIGLNWTVSDLEMC